MRKVDAVEAGGVCNMALELLDSLTKEPGIVLIAGVPLCGKSALLHNYFCHLFEREDVPVVLFTLEYGRIQVVNHFFAIMSSVDLQKIRKGTLTNEEVARVENSAKRLMKPRASYFCVDDTMGPTVEEISERIQKYLKYLNGQAGIVLIDSFDLLNDPAEHMNRFEQATVMLKKLKTVAMELGVSIVILKQMGCGRGNPNYRLSLEDLKSPANLEPYADAILFLHTTILPYPQTLPEYPIELEVAKCSGQVKLTTKRLLLDRETFKITTEPDAEPNNLDMRQ